MKVIKKRIIDAKRLIPVAAAVTAVIGFSSCAALEMLDSMAAEEENKNTVTEAPAVSASVSASDDEAAETAAPEETVSAEDSSNADAMGIITDLIGGGDTQSSEAPAETSAPPADAPAAALPDDEQQTQSLPDESVLPDDPYTQLSDDNSSMTDSSIYSADVYMGDSSLGTPVSETPAGGGGAISPYLSYSEIVRRTAEHVAADPSYKSEFCKYYITDIDDNGVNELLVETGTIEADRTVYVYTFDGIQTVPLGNFVSWHTTLGDGNGVIYTETSAMGSFLIGTIRIQNGQLLAERSEEPTSESQLTMPLIGHDLSDTSALEALR